MNAQAAKRVVEEHFQLFADLQGVDVAAAATGHQEITASAKQELAARFVSDFPRAVVDDHWRLVGLERVTAKVGRKEFTEQTIAPLVEVADHFVPINVQFAGEVFLAHALVTDSAEPGDTNSIVDPVTGTFTSLATESLTEGSKHLHWGFHNGFGTHVADYDVDLSATCDAEGLRACDGSAGGHDARPMMSAHGDFHPKPPAKVDECCEMSWVVIGTGGWPNVKLKWSNASSDFDVEVGAFAWTYFRKSGTMTDCCARRPLVVRPLATPAHPRPLSPPVTVTTTVKPSGEVQIEVKPAASPEQPEKPSCAKNMPHLLTCAELEREGYRHTSEDDALHEAEQLHGMPKGSLHLARRKAATDGPCAGEPGAWHYAVLDAEDGHYGSIVECRCCLDTKDGPRGRIRWRYIP